MAWRVARAWLLAGFLGLQTTTAWAKSAADWQKEYKTYEKDAKWPEAKALLDKALKEHPKDAWLNVFMGFTLRNQGKPKEAVVYLETAMKAAPTDAGVKLNYVVGLVEAMQAFQKDGDLQKAAAFGETGLKQYPEDKDIKPALIAVYTAAKDDKKLAELNSTTKDPTQKAVIDATAKLSQGKDKEAADAFKKASDGSSDWKVDDQIAKAYRSKVESLPYDKQMASPYQDQVVVYATKAVTKYFKANPMQPKSIGSPLKKFCVGQAAGGKSFHYGLTGHYSWDLVGCGGKDNMGDAILSVADGVVTEVIAVNPDRAPGAPVDTKAQGNVIRIKYGDVTGVYAHIKKGSAKVKKGQSVKKGQELALVGNSGVTSGPHLHFMLTKGDDQVTVPVSFTGLFRGPQNAAAGTALQTSPKIEMGFVYSTAQKL